MREPTRVTLAELHQRHDFAASRQRVRTALDTAMATEARLMAGFDAFARDHTLFFERVNVR